DLRVGERDRIGLVGANGAGKTTLLKIISNNMEPDMGTVQLPADWSVGILTQQDQNPPHCTVWEHATEAYAPAWQTEAQMRTLENEMADMQGGELEEAVHRHADLLQKFESQGGFEAESRCAGALCGLGLPRETWERQTNQLSGGQLRRLALARLLLQKPTLLLLDEPTNHLDLQAMRYLEGVLRAWEGAVVCVSHDRWLLDAVCGRIAELQFGRLAVYTGNYTTYLEKSAAEWEQKARAYKLQQRDIARQEAIIAKYRQFNREKSIRAAESRQRLLDRVERLEKPQKQAELKLQFPQAPHVGWEVLRTRGLTFSYGSKPLIENFDFDIHQGDRIGVVGPNGCGKTTLLKLMCGLLSPLGGSILPAANLKTGWFDQHQATLDATGTVLDELRNAYPLVTDTRLRTLLAAFLFPGEDVFAEISVLSGGERARLMLLKLLLSAPNLLALDEPTNHLDMPACIALEEALLDWPGTLLFVSHDRFFIERIATRLIVFEPCEDGFEIKLFEGGWQDYLAYCDKQKQPETGTQINQTQKRKDARAERDATRARQAARRKLEECEQEIERLEREKSQLEKKLADPGLYADPDAARRVAVEYREVEEKLAVKIEEWGELGT
ncbi:MAG: ABC-F family ATP-binding cassette domain-containing protein, partial [Clostridia bacterium]|nr:ABC-F family ATP-binding cassette domain-containing protein [Clostridia bacterium]